MVKQFFKDLKQEFAGYNSAKLMKDVMAGLTVCAKTGTAEVGSDKKPNAMLTGFALDGDMPIAFIICVEDGGYGAQVCIPIAQSILECLVER